MGNVINLDFLASPRMFFLLLPAEPTIDLVINELLPFLNKGDIVIDVGKLIL